MDNKTFLQYIVKDTRYHPYSLHELKLMRKKMIEDGLDKYELALIQYEIMKREGTLSNIATCI